MPISWPIVGLIVVSIYAAALTGVLLRRRRAPLTGASPRRILTENMADPMIVVGRDGRIVDLNLAAGRSLGLTRVQALAAQSEDVLPYWPEVEAVCAGWSAPLRQGFGGQAERELLARPTEILLNGLSYELTVWPLPGDDSRLISLRDVSLHRRADLELRRAKQAAEIAERAKGQFLAMMSHEIRTPLNGVVGFAELLQDTTLNAEQAEFVQMAVQSGRSLLVIMDDILDYAKIEAGQLILEEVAVDLPALLAATLEPLQAKAAAKGFPLTWSLAPGTPANVRADPSRLAQILSHLVGNAVKFTQQGGVKVKVSGQVVSAVAPPVVILSWEVADTGIGIPAESLARLIRPFAQADESTTRSYGGAGLGLAITRRLCELMGGRLAVTSKLGTGSTFTATVQARVDVAVPVPAALLPSERPARRLKILACEDNEINRRLLDALLRRRGHQIDFAEDGIEGLKQLGRGQYDLIFVDLAMPRMDGREFVRRLRAQEAERGEAPRYFIALTASVMKGERERCLAAGMNDYLPKPIEQAALDQALARFAVTESGTAPAS
jgi:signal transduction histidine kinase/ActR/RegA family two-component response regulator